MRAVVCPSYGGPEVLELRELPKPVPRNHEVLVAIAATTVSSGDVRVRALNLPRGFGALGPLALGFSRPRQPVLGTEFAGHVESVGKDVRAFAVGDEVFGFGGAKMGCYVEFRCFPEDGLLAPKPKNLSFEEAAALCFGGTTALDFYRRGRIQKGERVLVNGASGSVGTAAVQLAKHFGAEVIGVSSANNLQLVRSLGADRVIDYAQEDFARECESYDIILDAAGTAPFSRCREALRPKGRLLVVLGTLPDLLTAPWYTLTSGRTVIAGPASERAEDVRLLGRLAESGVLRPAIDRSYPLERVADAHRYVDLGHKRGNVVLTLSKGVS